MRKEAIRQFIPKILEQAKEKDFITFDELHDIISTSERVRVSSVAASLPPSLKMARLMRKNQWIIFLADKEDQLRHRLADEVFYEFRRAKRSQPYVTTNQPAIGNATQTETSVQALKQVIIGLAPLLIDAGERVQLDVLASRVRWLEPLLDSVGLIGGRDQMSHTLLAFYESRPDVFRADRTSEGRYVISIRDRIGLQILRLSSIDLGLYNLHIVAKGSFPASSDIAKTLSKFISKVDIVGSDYKYVARAISLGRLHPKWVFKDFEAAVSIMNDSLRLHGLRLISDATTGNIILVIEKLSVIRKLLATFRRLLKL